MKIEFSLGQYREYKETEVEEGTTVEELYLARKGETEHVKYACSVDNDVMPLTYKITKPCRVRLLDIRSKQTFMIYQNSLVLLLLKAASEIAPDVSLVLQTSINDGLYLRCTDHELSEDEIAKIYIRMKKLAEADLPIEARDFTAREGRKLLREKGMIHSSDLLRRLKEDEKVKIYTLDGYTDFFYDYLVPSTGYIKEFELMKYRGGVLIRYPQPDDPDVLPGYVDEYMLYNAIEEQRKWNDLLGVRYVSDLNEIIEHGDVKTMIQLSEALHDKKIVEIAETITQQKKRVILILGPSSSGKTTFARRLMIQLMVNGLRPFYVGTDDYFKDRAELVPDEHGELNFENIDALDVELFNKQMNQLLAGEEVDMPVFDFMTGDKVFGKRFTRLEKGQPIVIEGIHAFNHALTGDIDESEKYRIYISPLTQVNLDTHNRIATTDTRIIRRMVRDSRTRGNGPSKTLHTWKTVHSEECRNIFPYTSEADVFFNSVHVYEMAVFKKYAVPLLESVGRDDTEYSEAQRLLRIFSLIDSIDDETAIDCSSILREFIGGSVFE